MEPDYKSLGQCLYQLAEAKRITSPGATLDMLKEMIPGMNDPSDLAFNHFGMLETMATEFTQSLPDLTSPILVTSLNKSGKIYAPNATPLLGDVTSQIAEGYFQGRDISAQQAQLRDLEQAYLKQTLPRSEQPLNELNGCLLELMGQGKNPDGLIQRIDQRCLLYLSN